MEWNRINLELDALDLFETITEIRVVRVVLKLAAPGQKLTMQEIGDAARLPLTQAKRGIATALANRTLVALGLEGKEKLRTYSIGPKLAPFVWAQNVPESDKGSSVTDTECAQTDEAAPGLGTKRVQTLSDTGTKCAQNEVPPPVVSRAGMRSSRKPIKESTRWGSNKGNENGATAPGDDGELDAAAPLSPDAQALERKLLKTTPERRDAFEYLCAILRSPWRTVDDKRRAEVVVTAQTLYDAEPPLTVDTARRFQKEFRKRGPKNQGNRRIPLNTTLCVRYWTDLLAESDEADDVPDPPPRDETRAERELRRTEDRRDKLRIERERLEAESGEHKAEQGEMAGTVARPVGGLTGSVPADEGVGARLRAVRGPSG